MIATHRTRNFFDVAAAAAFSLFALFEQMLTLIFSTNIDVKDIGYVINYDFSSNVEDYIHRIGRTGRAGTKGTSITFFTTENAKSSRDLVKILREANQNVPPELEEMVSRS